MIAVPAAAPDFHPTERQQRAIEHINGPLEVLAGPGTGKTFVLTQRHAWLIATKKAWKYDVLSLTFTRQAAHEMAYRIQLLLDEDVENLPVRTIHSHARIILLNDAMAGKEGQKPFRVFDERQAYRVLRRAMETEGVSERAWPITVIAAEIETAKERGIEPGEYLTVPDSPAQQVITQVYQRYQDMLKKANAYDFADLIMAAVKLLEAKADLREQLHLQHRFLQVDEWQDTNTAQYRLIRLLTGPDRNLFVVGSEAQAIYGWRRANYKKLVQRFYADFPNAEQHVLTENWRSTTSIITASRALFNGQYRDVDLIAMRGDGKPVQLVRVDNELEEAAFVALEAQRLNQQGRPWKEFGVLYRSASQVAYVEQELLQRGIPYRMTQDSGLYDRREARHMLAYLRYALDGSEQALAQIVNAPARGLGPVTIRRLKGEDPTFTLGHLMNAFMDDSLSLRQEVKDAAEKLADFLFDLSGKVKHARPDELVEYIFVATGYEEWLMQEMDWHRRIRTIRNLQEDAARYSTAQAFLDGVVEKAGWQNQFPDEDTVTLSTIHSAKGRQWEIVFVLGMEEGLLPHRKAVGQPGQPDSPEERRLAYVAWTRPCDLLYLMVASTREYDARRVETRPSRYLMRIPPEIVERK